MSNILIRLEDENKIHPPSFLVPNTVYLTYMGSKAYATQLDKSDLDVYGVTVPPLKTLYPSSYGHIEGFANDDMDRFDQWQETNILHENGTSRYDFAIYSIAKYFQLCMKCNPNMIDSLFTPANCIVHMTKVGEHIRNNRKLFLSKACYHTFTGYAYSQFGKIKGGTNKANPERKHTIELYGYDVKFGYHLIRLLDECEMILREGDLDLQTSKERLKSIRRGEWKLEDIERYFKNSQETLDDLYHTSSLQHKPDEIKIKQLLTECISMFYASQQNEEIDIQAYKQDQSKLNLIRKLKELINDFE